MAEMNIQVASIFNHPLLEKKNNNVVKIPEITNILMTTEPYGSIMTVDWDRIHNQLNACF